VYLWLQEIKPEIIEMKKRNKYTHGFLNVIWDTGTYISTRINEDHVVNTYYVDGFFVDLFYDSDEGKIIEVFIDDTFNLNSEYHTQIKGFHVNYN
jgi:hypothetical protein